MKRWTILTVVAVAFGASGLTTQADLPQPGTACGSTAPIAPAVVGDLNPGEADWYDASYSEPVARKLKLDVSPEGRVPPNPFPGPSAVMDLYEWDTSTNTCRRIDEGNCQYDLIAPCPLGGFEDAKPILWDWGAVTQPGPGDYQVKVSRPDCCHIGYMAYTVRVGPGPVM